MTSPTILNESDAAAYLASIGSSTEVVPLTTKEDHTISQNDRIIKAADTLLLDRLENWDGSLRITDIVSAKDSAFKLNQKLLGLDDQSNNQLIPSVINISIINNH